MLFFVSLFFFFRLSSHADLMSGMMEQSGRQSQCEGLIKQTQKSDEHETDKDAERERGRRRQECILAGVS